MIEYKDNIDNIHPSNVEGFFAGWPNLPSQQKHLEMLSNSDYKIIAIDPSTGKVIGFINAITDKVLTAYIPLLEVYPSTRVKA